MKSERIFEATGTVAIFSILLAALSIPAILFLRLTGHFQMAADCMVSGAALMSLTALCVVVGLFIRIMQ